MIFIAILVKIVETVASVIEGQSDQAGFVHPIAAYRSLRLNTGISASPIPGDERGRYESRKRYVSFWWNQTFIVTAVNDRLWVESCHLTRRLRAAQKHQRF
ncbi:hypothetical protein OIK40_13845 [Erythrobacter sp. sf7]|uniref:Secreted protein n=1 Tax=Erythrobacter fulvus TaxID=2987523 RepID=A0ABT5JUC0_9SPHN|nr:hypothetical protein [Erythrobacter fulvus]MDC8755728.1 hypothetical protein [Erythrobacter fulvus]